MKFAKVWWFVRVQSRAWCLNDDVIAVQQLVHIALNKFACQLLIAQLPFALTS